MAMTNLGMWVGFLAIISLLLAIDLGIFHRKSHVVTPKESLAWVITWASLAVGFGLYVGWRMGTTKALEFFTGYVIEQSLSVDNLFVMVLIFRSFGVPRSYQHRVLFWGIMGAIVLRGIMILVGVELVSRFHWVMYIFGAFLLVTGLKLLFSPNAEPDPQENLLLKFIRRFIPSTNKYHDENFFVREQGHLVATPLFAAVVVIEAMDVVFAVDSIPAIFAVTLDPFIVFTSNIFAILGLRSLYFLLADIVDKFVHLKYGLAVILCFIGVKMLAEKWLHIPVLVSLAVIVTVFGISILTSVLRLRRS